MPASGGGVCGCSSLRNFLVPGEFAFVMGGQGIIYSLHLRDMSGKGVYQVMAMGAGR